MAADASALGMTAVTREAERAECGGTYYQDHGEPQQRYPGRNGSVVKRVTERRGERDSARDRYLASACRIRAPRNATLGSGVPLVRFKTPASRWKLTDMAMLR